MRIFDIEFVNRLTSELNAACADGGTITSADLTQRIGLDPQDAVFVSAAVKRHCDSIAVQKGPRGGFYRTDVPRKVAEKAAAVEQPLPEGFLDAVRNELERGTVKGKGVASSYLLAKLDNDWKDISVDMIRRAAEQVGGYKPKPGLGWCKAESEGVSNPESN